MESCSLFAHSKGLVQHVKDMLTDLEIKEIVNIDLLELIDMCTFESKGRSQYEKIVKTFKLAIADFCAENCLEGPKHVHGNIHGLKSRRPPGAPRAAAKGERKIFKQEPYRKCAIGLTTGVIHASKRAQKWSGPSLMPANRRTRGIRGRLRFQGKDTINSSLG